MSTDLVRMAYDSPTRIPHGRGLSILADREIMADPTATPKTSSPQQVAKTSPPRKRGRWMKLAFVLLILLGIFGWFAPTIVATSVVRNQLVKRLFPDFSGVIDCGEMSIGWASPIVIKNFRLEDEDDRTMLEVAEFSTSETLWTLVTRPGQMGTFKILDPVVHVSLSDSDSNVERVLAKLGHRSRGVDEPVTGDSGPTKSAACFVVEIDNARVELEHSVSNRTSQVDPISIRLVSNQGIVEEFELSIGNPPSTVGGASATDWLVARYGNPSDDQPSPDANKSPNAAPGKHAVLRAMHWKLDRLSPILPRFLPNAELGGQLNADTSIVLAPSSAGMDWDWNGTVSIEQLLVAGIESLKRDRLMLQQVELTGRAATTEGRLAMHDVKLTTDIGELTATGDMPLNGHSQKTSLELVQSLLSDEDYHIDGRVDLKKLATLLPQTLRIRDGIEITAGDVKVQFVGVAVDGVRRWSGAAGIVGLSALNRGQVIPWDKPLVARVNAHRDRNAIVVDLAECRSDFLQISGKGTFDDARFTASGDLSKLLTNVERFLDLGIERLAGQMKASGEIRRSDANHISLTSKILLDDFAYVVSKNNVWSERHLELSVVGAGQTDVKPALTKIDTGEIHLNGGGDTLDLVLRQPVDLVSASPTYVATGGLKGNLASWQNRLRPFVSVNDWRITGNINLATTVTANARQVDVSQLSVVLQTLEVDGPEWLIQDPELKLETTGYWDVPSRKWTSPKITLTGKALTLDVADLEWTVGPPGQASLTGTASYRADLTQLSNWKNLAIKNPSYYLIGSLSGTAGITRQDNLLVGQLDAQAEKFIVAGQGIGSSGQPQWVALWKEPVVKLVSKGSYDSAADKLTLDLSHLDLGGLAAEVSGKLDGCSTNQRIDVTGDLAYDWDMLMKRLGPQLGQNLQLTGKDHRPFSIKGSLVRSSAGPAPVAAVPASPVSFQPGAISGQGGGNLPAAGGLVDLSGQAGFGWTTANVYGITTGAGNLSAQIEQGVCRFAPLDLVVNDGKLHLTPTIYMDRNPFLLVLPQEKLIDQISLSQNLCSNSLKLILPMLADSAQVEGKISVDMQAASLPLLAPATGTASGVLSIHRAQARPGTVALQITSAIDQVRTMITRRQANGPNRDQVWLEMTEQQVPFRLEQGRMYHEGMTFMVSNVSVKTSGSVGLDNTLNLIAEIAIKDEWLGNNKAVAGLKGKSIQIPITGTTSRPQIDPSVFTSLLQQLGGSAIEGLLQDKVGDGLNGVINDGLDKLLRGRK